MDMSSGGALGGGKIFKGLAGPLSGEHHRRTVALKDKCRLVKKLVFIEKFLEKVRKRSGSCSECRSPNLPKESGGGLSETALLHSEEIKAHIDIPFNRVDQKLWVMKSPFIQQYIW